MQFKKYFILTFTIALVISSMTSCKDDMQGVTAVHDCVFVQDDETEDGYISDIERGIMQDCNASRFTDKDLLHDHLIGEWELIGHGEGWFPKISQPCSYITFSDDEMIIQFKNEYVDTTTTHTWSTEEVQSPSFDYLRLNIEPNAPVWFGFTTFCDQYMFGDATPLDGNMYLYEKIQ